MVRQRNSFRNGFEFVDQGLVHEFIPSPMPRAGFG
jgi:hypothetical protein